MADEDVHQIAVAAHRARKATFLRLDDVVPPINFVKVASVEGQGMLTDAAHGAWPTLLKQVEVLLIRPGLASYDRLRQKRDPDAFRMWAERHYNDPLAPVARQQAERLDVELARERARRAAMQVTLGPDAAQTVSLRRIGLMLGGLVALAILTGAVTMPLWANKTAFGRDSMQFFSETMRRIRPAPKAESAAAPTIETELARGAARTAPTLGRPEKPFPEAPIMGSSVYAARYASDRSAEAAEIAKGLAARAEYAGNPGLGVVRLPDGAVYLGQVDGGRPSGYGVRRDPPSEGGAQFAGAIDGAYGETSWPNGLAFLGLHENGRPNGMGLLRYPNEQVFEGGFDGRRQGAGILWEAGRAAVIEAGLWRDDRLVRKLELNP